MPIKSFLSLFLDFTYHATIRQVMETGRCTNYVPDIHTDEVRDDTKDRLRYLTSQLRKLKAIDVIIGVACDRLKNNRAINFFASLSQNSAFFSFSQLAKSKSCFTNSLSSSVALTFAFFMIKFQVCYTHHTRENRCRNQLIHVYSSQCLLVVIFCNSFFDKK